VTPCIPVELRSLRAISARLSERPDKLPVGADVQAWAAREGLRLPSELLVGDARGIVLDAFSDALSRLCDCDCARADPVPRAH
jgi:hypothetical protein